MLYGKKNEKIERAGKKTRQGQGRGSKPRGDRKMSRGQGK